MAAGWTGSSKSFPITSLLSCGPGLRHGVSRSLRSDWEGCFATERLHRYSHHSWERLIRGNYQDWSFGTATTALGGCLKTSISDSRGPRQQHVSGYTWRLCACYTGDRALSLRQHFSWPISIRNYRRPPCPAALALFPPTPLCSYCRLQTSYADFFTGWYCAVGTLLGPVVWAVLMGMGTVSNASLACHFSARSLQSCNTGLPDAVEGVNTSRLPKLRMKSKDLRARADARVPCVYA